MTAPAKKPRAKGSVSPRKADAGALTPKQIERNIVSRSPMTWLELHGSVMGLEQQIITAPAIKANWMQQREEEILSWMEANGHPGRIIKLKGRRQGSSTGSLAIMAHRVRQRATSAFICGLDFDKNVRVMEGIFWRFVDTDRYDWGVKGSQRKGSGGEFTNGSTLTLYSANSGTAGRGQGAQFGMFTEAAFYPTTDGRSESDLYRSLFQLVPRKPGTVIIIESTPNGASGKYYETWQGAISFEDLQAGRMPEGWNGFVKLFYPWHEFQDYESPCGDEEAAAIMGTLSDREQELVSEFKHMTAGRLKWRRMAISGPDFDHDEDLFEAEYPSDEVRCFLLSGRRAFAVARTQQMKKQVSVGEAPKFGVLKWVNEHSRQVTFRDTGEDEALCKIFERPTPGLRYLLAVDPATGASNTSGADPDNHGVGMWRAGFFHGGAWCPPMLAARLADCYAEKRHKKKQAVCRWDLDVLCRELVMLSLYYGGAMIVPEANAHGLALIELLKQAPGVPMYQRRVFNRIEQKDSTQYGWRTDASTRAAIIENLKRAVRMQGESGEGLVIRDEAVISEFATMVVTASGKEEAMGGCHDDQVMMSAIALANMDCARAMAYPVRRGMVFPGQGQERRDFSCT